MAKGPAFERECCKLFSLWYTAGRSDDLFWRTHSSGARATQLAKRGKKLAGQVGDMCAIDERGRSFCDALLVQMKTGYPRTSVHDLVDYEPSNCRKPQFLKFIEETHQQWLDAGLTGFPMGWLLITRRPRRPALIWMRRQTWIMIFGMHYPPDIIVRWNGGREVVSGNLLKDFFARANPRRCEASNSRHKTS